jgi:uncharacterized iron-regulated membrane protein
MTTTSDQTRPDPTQAPPTPGTWTVLRPVVLRIHFYAGVLVAPFLAVLCLTGLAYVFSPQLDDLVYGHELLVGEHTGAPRPLDEQIAAATAAHPEGAVTSVAVDSDPGRTTGVVMAVPGLPEDVERTVYVDPYTAGVRGALDTWWDSPPLQTTLDSLHRNLLLGEPGRIYSELAASWLWVLVLGGLALWVGRRRSRRRAALHPPRGGRPGRARLLGWHGAVGLWVAVALLFISATGLTWSQFAGERFTSLVVALDGSTPELAAAPVPAGSGAPVSTQTVLDTARGAGLAGPLKITLPDGPTAPVQVAETARDWPVQRDAVAVDPGTGAVTEALRWADFPLMAKLTRIGVLAHMGTLFGLPNQLALAAMALGLLALLGWGYRMWWHRRPTRDGRARFTALAPRGVLRALSQPAAFAVVVLTVAVGWLLPLLGISLLAFLAADALAAAIARRRAGGAVGAARPPVVAARSGGPRPPH